MMNFLSIHKKLTVSNLLNSIFIIILLVVLLNSSAKALLIRAAMKLGLFQPNVSKPINTTITNSLPNISFQDVNRRILNLSDQKGKVIFMNFWATWCPPCIAEIPSINELYEELKDNKNIVFIMVDVDHDFSKSVPFINNRHFTIPIYETRSAIPGSLYSGSIPTTLIFNKNGQMVFYYEGASDYSNQKFRAYLSNLSH